MIDAKNRQRGPRRSQHAAEIDVRPVVQAVSHGTLFDVLHCDREHNLTLATDEQAATLVRSLGACMGDDR